MTFYNKIIKPIAFRFDPEKAHDLTIKALKAGEALLPDAEPDDYLLQINVLGKHFSNPFGLAAGFDKNAEVPNAMLKLGFGFVEVGTITPEPQVGNPKPRIFRLPKHQAVINRLGFNNKGHIAAYDHLRERQPLGIMGINIGANKTATDRIADYETGVSRFHELGDYLTINISSPNTPGLRDLQASEQLSELIERVSARKSSVPILVKIAPDLHDNDLADVTRIARKYDVAGLIISNTTIERSSVTGDIGADELGGLSGRPLMARSTQVLKDVYKTVGNDMVLVGVGGIASGADAFEKIKAGASLVQLYTALIYQGPFAVKRMKRELVSCLRAEGYVTLKDAIGQSVN